MPAKREFMGDLATVFAGIPTKSSDRQEVGRWGNVLTVRSLAGTGIDLAQLEEHGVVGRSVDQYRVQAGDLLLSSRSTSLKMGIVPKELDGCLINTTLIGVRCLPKLLPRLLAAWLDGPEGQAALQAVSQSGTVQMNITVAGLSRIVVPVPPMETQCQLVALLEAADEAHLAAVQAAEDRHQLATQIVAERLK
jgi:hypothetical protein